MAHILVVDDEPDLRRDTREKKNFFSISGWVFQINAKEAEAQGQKLPLTKSEYEICEYLALHHGQTFTREQIYEAVLALMGQTTVLLFPPISKIFAANWQFTI